MNAEKFGLFLKSLRKNKKLTIRQLDLYSGVSNSYISQMERGERGIPSPDILKKLSKALGVEYEELMIKAGYIEKGKPDQEDELSDNAMNHIIRELSERYNIDPNDEQKKKILEDFVKVLYGERK